jgi:hypothetical protein
MTPVPHLSREMPLSSPTVRVNYSVVSPLAENSVQTVSLVGQLLSDISRKVQDRLDVAAQVDGARQGAIAGAGDAIPAQQDDATIRGHAFNVAARDAVATRYELQGRIALSDYEQGNPADPVKFRSMAEAYINGQMADLQAYDPQLAQHYGADYSLRMNDAVTRIKGRQDAIARDQQLEGALRLQMTAQDELAQQAQDLFAGDPAQFQAKLSRMMLNAGKLTGTAHQVGPDGRPLFTARERITIEEQAKESVSENIGLAWLNTQPDMLTAFHTWQKGEAAVELAGDDGSKTTLQLRELLGEAGYRRAGDAFMAKLRSDLALQNQVETATDRAFKKNSDDVFSDLSVAAQDGLLTLQQVEDARGQMEPDKYLAVRALARSGGAAVSDGPALARIAERDAAGADVRAELRAAYEGGQLKTDDFIKYYGQNTARLGEGQRDPVSVGRDFVAGSLGSLSKEIGFAQSSAISAANAEYSVRVDDFVKKNERTPTVGESLDIGRDVVRRYSVMDLSSTISNLPTPMMMTPAQKFNPDLSVEDIRKIGAQTSAYFLKQHNGDQAAAERDEGYQEEMKLLKNYYDLLQMRNGVNGTGSTQAK